MSIDYSIVIPSVLSILTIIIVAYYNHKQYKQMNEQIKNQNEQIRLNFFSEYTRRYQDIILNFPENINEDTFSYDELEKEIRDKTMRYMRVYFDLCSEEYFLHQQNKIDEKVWKEWEDGMKIAFNKLAFKNAWKKITSHSDYYSDFKQFVNSIMNIDKLE